MLRHRYRSQRHPHRPDPFCAGALAALFAACVFLVAANAFSRDIYVNNKTGNDRRDGFNKEGFTEKTGPVRSIRRALELARNGDRIVLLPTGIPFHESITLTRYNHSGSNDLPFVIEGNGAILDGTESLDPRVWEHESGDIFRFAPPVNNSDFQHFRLFDRKRPLTRVEPEPGATRLPELGPNHWTLFNGKVYFQAEPGKRPDAPEDYKFSYTSLFTGITLFHVEHVRIHDVTVRGFQIDGISAFNSAKEIVLDNVLCDNNGRSGLYIGGASRLYAGFCTFEDNLGDQVLSRPFSRATLYACRVDPMPDVDAFQDRVTFEEAPDGETGAREFVQAAEKGSERLPMPEAKESAPPRPKREIPAEQTDSEDAADNENGEDSEDEEDPFGP